MATLATQVQPSSQLTVKSEMAFLKRDTLWEHEKPYKLSYEPINSSIPRTNHKPEVHQVEVHDLRQSPLRMSLDKNGFEVHRLNTCMKYEEFFDEQKISGVYLKELQQLVKKVCGGRKAIPLDAEIRRRHATFPTSTGENYQFPQPAFLTHIDVTVAGAREIIKKLYPTAAEEILKARIQCVTVWKPLKGPVEDWPLALCDATTLGPSDVVPSDVVYQKVATENYLVHFSDKQKWYYLDRQQPDEVFMFKAADSEPGQSARCAHGSFNTHKQVPDSSRRESVDVRVLVLHADIDYPEAGPWAF